MAIKQLIIYARLLWKTKMTLLYFFMTGRVRTSVSGRLKTG